MLFFKFLSHSWLFIEADLSFLLQLSLSLLDDLGCCRVGAVHAVPTSLALLHLSLQVQQSGNKRGDPSNFDQASSLTQGSIKL